MIKRQLFSVLPLPILIGLVFQCLPPMVTASVAPFTPLDTPVSSPPATGWDAENLTSLGRVDSLDFYTSVRELFTWSYDATAGIYVDETSDANSVGANDFPLVASPSGDPEGDIIYLGAMGQFAFIRIDFDTAGGTWDNDSITWKYWDGDSWEALSGISDGTNSFKTVGSQKVSWTSPTDWATTQVNEINAYWVAAEFTDSGKTVDTQPLGDQIWRGGRLFVTPDRVRVTDMEFDDDVYLYKSRTTGGTNDFTDYFSISVDSLTGEVTTFLAAAWLVNDTLDDMQNSANYLGFLVYENSGDDTNMFLLVQNYNSGTRTFSSDWEFELNRRYHIEIHYDESDGAGGKLHVRIYYDKARTDEAAHLTLALQVASQPVYTYWGPVWSRDNNFASHASWVAGDYHLDTEPDAGMFADSSVTFPISWTEEHSMIDYLGTWTADAEAGATVEEANHPLYGVECAHIIGNDGTDADARAYITTTSSTLTKAIISGNVTLVSGTLDAGNWRALIGMRDVTGNYIVQAAIANVGGTYYWRIQDYFINPPVGLSSQTKYSLSADTEYNIILATVIGQDSGGIAYYALMLWVDNVLVESKLTAQAHNLAFNAQRISVGNDIYMVTTGLNGGECYIRNVKYHDGTTTFPKVARGGVADADLALITRVTSQHSVDYGVSYSEIYLSDDNGATLTLEATLGPTANYDYSWAWPVWDSVNDEWLVFLETRHAVDGFETYLYHASDLSDLDGYTLANATWQEEDLWVFPTKIIEGTDLLVGIEVHDSGSPFLTASENYGTLELGDDYTLTTVGSIATAKLGYTSLSEPRVWRRPSDDTLCAIVRYDSAGPRDEMMHVDLSGNGTSWSEGVWPGEDWSDIAAGLTAFVFDDYMYIVGRDSQRAPWKAVIWQINAENTQLITERVWGDVPGNTVVWEAGNGEVDAANWAGNSLLDVTFGLGIASFRQVDVLVGLAECPATTLPPDPVGSTTATFWGNITIVDDNATEYAWVYNTTSYGDTLGAAPEDTDYFDVDPAVGGYQTVGPGDYGTGSYSLGFAGLLPDTTYYGRFMTFTTGWCSSDEFEILTESAGGIRPNPLIWPNPIG